MAMCRYYADACKDQVTGVAYSRGPQILSGQRALGSPLSQTGPFDNAGSSQ